MSCVAAFTFLAATAFAGENPLSVPAAAAGQGPAAAAAPHSRSQQQTVGLVLSGGGAKGIAHIGMIQALEEAEIPIDYISGTSMGAIVGSLYAIGYSPAEMMALLASDGFREWSSGTLPGDKLTLLLTPEPTPSWISVNLAAGPEASALQNLPTRMINPLPMSWAFMELYAPANRAAGGSFDRLMTPFRCVASDIYTHKPVVFANGQLADAVRASMSFPFVFQPIMVGDTLLYDGGLYDVYPVDVMMRDFKPDRVIGVDVSTPNRPPGLNNLMSQLENMIMTGYLPEFPDSIGVNIEFDLERYGLLGWSYAPEIYAIGYKRGRELADSLRTRIQARRTQAQADSMRSAFRSRVRPVEFSPEVRVTDAGPGQDLYIERLMTRGCHSDMSMDDARRGFYRAISTGRMRNLVPHALLPADAEGNDPDTLLLRADVDKPFALDVGGYLTSSSGSFVYAGAHYYPMRPDHFPSRASLEGWAGQTILGLRGRADVMSLHGAFISRFGLEVKALRTEKHEQEKMFYSFHTPAFLTSSDISANFFWQLSPTTNSTITLGAGYSHLTDRYHSALASDPADNGRDRVISNLFTLKGDWMLMTLDHPLLPTDGLKATLSAGLDAGRRHLQGWDQRYWRSDVPWGDFSGSFIAYYPLAGWLSLGAGLEAYWSTRPLLPDYSASLAQARAFCPVASEIDLYDPEFRANQYVSFGLHPVLKLGSRFQLRLDGWIYCPARRILVDYSGNAALPKAVYSEWFDRGLFLGEASLCMRLPAAGAVRAYIDYRTSHALRWHAGIALGLPIRLD